jgi:DNA segregation ATPase FtsK/SpoIIIE, S-DNA-T family
LPVGQFIMNDAAGTLSANRRARFPDADAHSISLLRHRLWQMRTPGGAPPAVFVGFAEQRIEDDPVFTKLTPDVRRPTALLGRSVDVGLSTVRLTLDATPGRHLAVLGTSPVGADVLHAATLSLAKQHEPGTATFLLAGLVPDADEVVDAAAATLREIGHSCDVLGVAGYRDALSRLVAQGQAARSTGDRTYLIVFGADAASSLLKQVLPATKRKGLDDLRDLLRDGPMNGHHVLGWWRGVRRLTDDLGPSGKDEISAVLALNVRGTDLNSLVGQFNLEWSPRSNRALYLDRGEDKRRLLVPFVRPGRFDDREVLAM